VQLTDDANDLEPDPRPGRAGVQLRTFLLLRIGFTAIPLTTGIDKFFNGLVYWPKYLAHWIANIPPATPQQIMYGIGVVEIVAGILVALKPRYAAYLVAAWLGGIILDLLTYSGYYDIALRDFGLMLGALSLGRLAAAYDPPGLRPKFTP
jgi:uncharacterized membrane protein YphA (DoxX/SURF4 family)